MFEAHQIVGLCNRLYASYMLATLCYLYARISLIEVNSIVWVLDNWLDAILHMVLKLSWIDFNCSREFNLREMQYPYKFYRSIFPLGVILVSQCWFSVQCVVLFDPVDVYQELLSSLQTAFSNWILTSGLTEFSNCIFKAIANCIFRAISNCIFRAIAN
jgi:hypothetical protein